MRTADGTISNIDDPSAGTASGQGTVAFAINTAGLIAGYCIDSSKVQHGFVLAVNGTFTTIDPPGTISTFADGINTAGDVCGYYTDASRVSHGFLWTP
ncbi:MAG: hypothetical protein WAM89_09015 [Terriglobales bacterium]